MESWGQEEVLVAWMNSRGAESGAVGMDEELWGGKRFWWHG